MHHSQKSSSDPVIPSVTGSDDKNSIWLRQIQEADVQVRILGSKEKVLALSRIAGDMGSSFMPITVIEQVFCSALPSPMHPFLLCMKKYRKEFRLMIRTATASSYMNSMRVDEACAEYMKGLLSDGDCNQCCYLALLTMQIYIPYHLPCKISAGMKPKPSLCCNSMQPRMPFLHSYNHHYMNLVAAYRTYNRQMIPHIKRYRTSVGLQVLLFHSQAKTMKKKFEILCEHAMFLPAEEIERCCMSVFGYSDKVAQDMCEQRGIFDFILAGSTLMYMPQLSQQDIQKVMNLYLRAAANGVTAGLHAIENMYKRGFGLTTEDSLETMAKWVLLYQKNNICASGEECLQAIIPLTDAVFRCKVATLDLD